QATTGAHNIYMGVFRVPPGARSRPHYHAQCERAVYVLDGRLRVSWGDDLEHEAEVAARDLVYVHPRESHINETLSETEAADYVVARISPREESVDVAWAG